MKGTSMTYLTRWQRPEAAQWSGSGHLMNLRDEIDRLFEAPLSALARTSQLLSGWTPALDVYEGKNELVVRTELPGLRKEDIHVALHQGTLSISGERKTENKHQQAQPFRAERFFGRFQRTVALPAPVAADKIKAEYKDGILVVTLPKAEEAKPKQINVKVN
jgi:HSP20 family protein